jgi:hypothetical protein
MSKFFTLAQRTGSNGDSIRRPSTSTPPARPAFAPQATSNSSSNLQPAFPPQSAGRVTPPAVAKVIHAEDGGPFKQEMVNRMDALPKGSRVLPPCDRCRRLHMDCIKNLTACLGCTKKHAKCAWREVRIEELAALTPGSYDNAFPTQTQDSFINPGFEDEELELRRRLQEDAGHDSLRVRTAQMVAIGADEEHEHVETFAQQELEEMPSPRIHNYPPVPQPEFKIGQTENVVV